MRVVGFVVADGDQRVDERIEYECGRDELTDAGSGGAVVLVIGDVRAVSGVGAF